METICSLGGGDFVTSIGSLQSFQQFAAFAGGWQSRSGPTPRPRRMVCQLEKRRTEETKCRCRNCGNWSVRKKKTKIYVIFFSYQSSHEKSNGLEFTYFSESLLEVRGLCRVLSSRGNSFRRVQRPLRAFRSCCVPAESMSDFLSRRIARYGREQRGGRGENGRNPRRETDRGKKKKTKRETARKS